MEKKGEWQKKVWILALDFKKAFDTVEHHSIWQALLRQNVPPAYVELLGCLYEGQTANVRTDRYSKPFKLMRGTKQGDPLSSLLFNAVLQDIVNDVCPRWQKLRHGLLVGACNDQLLSILRFADDCLLMAPSAVKLERMTEALALAARKRGLEIHPDKTKALTNTPVRQRNSGRKGLKILNMEIEVLPTEGQVK